MGLLVLRVIHIGQLEKLKAVLNWQERLRDFVDQLISDVPVEVGRN